MDFFTTKVSIIALILFYFSNTAYAESSSQFSTGLFINHSESIYKSTDSDENVFPLVSYDSDTFFTKELGVGYHLSDNLDVSVHYSGSLFDPDDSSDSDIQMLNERDGGFTAKAVLKVSVFETSIEQDISGEHNGYSANFKIGFPLLFTPSFFVKGSVGYTFVSKKMSEHLYSVSSAESARTSGRIATHESDSTSAKNYGLQLIVPLSKKATFITIVSHTKYDDETTSSPIVSESKSNSIIMIASYKF